MKQKLIDLIQAAAAEAADHQERFAAEDTEARKIVDIMEIFLRTKARVVYGGAAINAHLPSEKKFYDPTLYLPDYDFMTPDPLQDCADLITTFQAEGFDDVEAKFGIHEGTYKIFVNYRSAADITYMPADIYGRIVSDSDIIGGIHYASANFLRMNIYLELSRPAGDVSRWEKIYKRLLLLNESKPLRPGHCTANPLSQLGDNSISSVSPIITTAIEHDAVFLSGASLIHGLLPKSDEPILLITDKSEKLVNTLTRKFGLKAVKFDSVGELLPSRVELNKKGMLVAVVFSTVACHAYKTLAEPSEIAGMRLASLDLMIQMYYAFYFTDLQHYIAAVRLLCVINALIESETKERLAATPTTASDVFPLDCVGHQPTLAELKRSHRQRVLEKRAELQAAVEFRTDEPVRRQKKQHYPAPAATH